MVFLLHHRDSLPHGSPPDAHTVRSHRADVPAGDTLPPGGMPQIQPEDIPPPYGYTVRCSRDDSYQDGNDIPEMAPFSHSLPESSSSVNRTPYPVFLPGHSCLHVPAEPSSVFPSSYSSAPRYCLLSQDNSGLHREAHNSGIHKTS